LTSVQRICTILLDKSNVIQQDEASRGTVAKQHGKASGRPDKRGTRHHADLSDPELVAKEPGVRESPPRTYEAGRLRRIFAVSPFVNATGAEILRFLATLPKALIVLPGHSRNSPSPRQIQDVIRGGSAAFVEGDVEGDDRPAFIVRKQHITRIPSQIFSKKPTAADMDRLVTVLPQRTISVGNRTITFFICGEILAFNPDGSPKHRRRLDFDIIVNPGHTMMGHWNHLGRKLENLSRDSLAVHVTNNTCNRHNVSTDVRIYRDVNRQERHPEGNIAWSECEIAETKGA
jgi:hypothetical protein